MNRFYVCLSSVLRHFKTRLPYLPRWPYLLLLLGLLSTAHAQTRTNVALQANGGVATASSIWTTGYEPGSANNGVRTGAVWGAGGGWHDNSPGVFPDWLQITFNSSKTIDEVNVYSIQDNYANPSEPTAASSFTLYGLAAFEVQYWNGTTWVTVPNGAISNNNLVWRKVSFPAITTDRIRVLVNSGLSSYSRIAEVEVYGASSTANAAPTISLTSPSNNSSVTAPANLTLNANATDSDGTISQVAFYNGTTLLNTDTTAPYSYSLNATAGSYTLSAKATDNLGASTTSAVVNVTVNPNPGTTRTNVALQANGGLATASSIWATGYEPGSANNGVRTGAVWGAGGGWHDNTPGVFPDWLQITFNSSKTIDEVNVYSIQDNYANPSEPTTASSFTLYGLAAFEVQSWNGTTWVTVPNGAISNNTLVWRKVSFPAISTDRIRILVSNGLSSYSRIAEVEAYGVSSTANVAPTVSLTSPSNNSSVTAPANLTLNANAADSDGTISKVEFYNGATLLNTDTTAPYSYSLNAIAGSYTLTAKATDNLGASTTSAVVNVTVNPSTTRSNVALQANGGVATASSIWTSGYEPGSANNGVRTGAVWGAGGGWHDNTPGVFPDWLQITFNSSKTIDEVNVYSIQDNYANPSEPTAASSFTLYGLAAFEVQYWNGTTWVTVPNGAVSNNNLVWRKISFPAISTDRIRVLVTNGLSSYSRIAEVEVYAAAVNPAPTASNIYYVFADHLNTPRVITDTANKTVWRWDSDPFGTDLPNEDVDGDGRRFSYNLRFPGQYWDKETGLHQNYFRDFDPPTGRYLQSDPIGLLGGINTYGYALSNPLRYTDPLGLDPFGNGNSTTGSRIPGPPTDVFFPGTAANNAFVQSVNQIVNAVKEMCQTNTCPACTPYPVGTIGYQGPEVGVKGRDAGTPHYNLYQVEQIPSTCKCIWKEKTKALSGNHHYYDQPNPAMGVNLNGSSRPPNYPR